MTNNVNIRTFNDLLESRRNIRIPVYHRTYCWGREQYGQFYDDLVEQNGGPYYLGLFIFEDVYAEGAYFVIDGLQRLTTAVLFLAALEKVKTGNNENIVSICETYLPARFSTVYDDDEELKQLIKNFSCGDKKAETISQRKIKKAFDFFSQKLEKVSLEEAAKLQKSLEKARIGIFDMGYKCEAYQVFEYQNNRGIHASTR